MQDDKNCFLSLPYLTAIAQSFSNELDFCYLTVLDTETSKPVLIASYQLVPFVFKGDTQPPKILHHCSQKSDGFFMLYMLVCGNVFMAGAHGFLKSNDIDDKTAFDFVEKGMAKAYKMLRKQTGKKISVQLFKEFTPQMLSSSSSLEEKGYQDFEIDMYMSLPIDAAWSAIDSYFDAFKAKFRTKARSVYAKASALSIRSFSETEILNNHAAIDVLFLQVLGKSEYQFGVMNAIGFASLKQHLGDQFIFRAVLREDALIGFSTSFINGFSLEANFVGIDYNQNIQYAVYQRLLYDYVSLAIDNKVEVLHYGRTSELLKSSLGAIPVPMKLYAKHASKITHLLMSSILKKQSPSSFELRKPFKASYYEK
ncbi:MAG: hypothetical protein ACJAYD_000621 [Patiriisocius sp.]